MAHDLYKKVYDKQAAFYRSRPAAKKALALGNHFLTAAVFAAYVEAGQQGRRKAGEVRFFLVRMYYGMTVQDKGRVISLQSWSFF